MDAHSVLPTNVIPYDCRAFSRDFDAFLHHNYHIFKNYRWTLEQHTRKLPLHVPVRTTRAHQAVQHLKGNAHDDELAIAHLREAQRILFNDVPSPLCTALAEIIVHGDVVKNI